MRITKCDICKKTISSDNSIWVEIRGVGFKFFEICSNCSKPIIKLLKNKRLIENDKIEKKNGRKK